jgi:hypothetical protein
MSLPSKVGLPQEMMVGTLGYSLPHEARSQPFRLFPTGVNSVTTTYNVGAASSYAGDIPANPVQIIFDLPAGTSPDMFLDPRFTMLNFRAQISVASAGSACVITQGFLRSSAFSYIQRMYINGQSGNVVEDVPEYGINADNLINVQMSPSTRQSLAVPYGMNSTYGNNQGHVWGIFSNNTMALGQSESHSYSIPVISSLIGATANQMCNIGRTAKLQLVLSLDAIMPLTIQTGSATTAGSFTILLTDFSLSLETISIGMPALQLLDSTMINDGVSKKAYYSGTTYRTITNSIPQNTVGTISLLAGVRGASVKNMAVRFLDVGSTSVNASVNGKYDSKNPSLSSVNFNVGGIRYPPQPINPLLNPALTMSETQKAYGSFNNTQFVTNPILRYAVLAQGGNISTLTTTSGTQDWLWNSNQSSATQLAGFLFATNTEICSKKGIYSGINTNSISTFLEANVLFANTNIITVFITIMLDCIYIHDVQSGEIQFRA